MSTFDQKPRFASRPQKWLTSTRSRAERFLSVLSEQLQTVDLPGPILPAKSPRLLSYRNEFRQLMAHQETVPVLQGYLTNSNPAVRSLAVWLLSKHANRIILLGLDKRYWDPSPQVRKHLAKALRRLEAWQILEKMVAEHPNDTKVSWFARSTPNQKNYRDRLANYSSGIDQTHRAAAAGPSRMPLWFRDEYWGGVPPKNIRFLREILLRIQKLVHG